jgi:hypothetical protein
VYGKFSKKWVWPVLVIPDLFFTFVALWLALFTRFNSLPTEERFWLHVQVFIPMILVWLLVFFVGDYCLFLMMIRGWIVSGVRNSSRLA